MKIFTENRGVAKNINPWVPDVFGTLPKWLMKFRNLLSEASVAVGSILCFSKISGFHGIPGTHTDYAPVKTGYQPIHNEYIATKSYIAISSITSVPSFHAYVRDLSQCSDRSNCSFKTQENSLMWCYS